MIIVVAIKSVQTEPTKMRACKQPLSLRHLSLQSSSRHHCLRWITIGMRREEKSIWESRAPLAPNHVRELISRFGMKFIVQPSSTRVFSDSEYQAVGAKVTADLHDADVIIGVKEIPPRQVISGKTHLCFSHTHKGQNHNLTTLKEYVAKGASLVDYELLTDETGKRLVAFGKFAGYAGFIDCLHGLGLQLLKQKHYRTPFLNVAMAHQYPSLDAIRANLRDIGTMIKEQGFAPSINPILIIFTGSGNVSKGAQELMRELPHKFIKPDEVQDLFSESADNKLVYGCVIEAQDYCVRKDGSAFSLEDYHQNPQAYTSVFHEKFAPFATAIVNGIYWEEKFPRLLTVDHLNALLNDPNSRLLTIADISCDIKGSIEATDRTTTFEEPFLTQKSSHEKNSIQILAIDNLPAQLPKDATEFFGDALTPILATLSTLKASEDGVITRGTIVNKGNLHKKHEWLSPLIAQSSKKRVLILGSGYVSGPVTQYLGNKSDYEVTVASNNLEEATAIAKLGKTTTPVALAIDISNHNDLNSVVSQSDLVISLVPATMHLPIAKACLTEGKHLVTASYISPAMQELNQAARDKGLVFMNEIGLDPGLDHLSALKIIDAAKAAGQRIVSFSSWCGGLPAPECANNPLGYKFSWSPRGVLLAALNDARYLRDGSEVAIAGPDLMASAIREPCVSRLNLEGVPNRDSLKYIPLYGLEGIQGMLRGTLRYAGFCHLMSEFIRLGLLSLEPLADDLVRARSWKQVTHALLSKSQKSPMPLSARTMEAMEWLGLFSEGEAFVAQGTLLDSFCHLLLHKLKYGPGEKDMVVMQHQFILENADGSQVKVISDLMEFGEIGGFSAMARTVGYPAAMAAEMILEGGLGREMAGVLAPTHQCIYEPLLQKLRDEAGIRFTETTIKL